MCGFADSITSKEASFGPESTDVDGKGARFCIQMMILVLNNDELRIKNDETSIQNDEICIQNDVDEKGGGSPASSEGETFPYCIYMPAIGRPLSDCCLLCIYMPAIDRPLSDRRWLTASGRDEVCAKHHEFCIQNVESLH